MPDSLTQKMPVGDILQGGVEETGKIATLEAVKFILREGVKIYSQPRFILISVSFFKAIYSEVCQ